MSEVVAVDGARAKLSRAARRIEKFKPLENSQLYRREIVSFWSGFSAAASGVFSMLFAGAPLALTGSTTAGIWVVACSAAVGIGGLVPLELSSIYERERYRRNAEQSKSWKEGVVAELKERFGIELSLEDLDRLEYPNDPPKTDDPVRYGTIEKLIPHEEGVLRLEKITLAWHLGEFKLLREASNLRELNGKALA